MSKLCRIVAFHHGKNDNRNDIVAVLLEMKANNSWNLKHTFGLRVARLVDNRFSFSASHAKLCVSREDLSKHKYALWRKKHSRVGIFGRHFVLRIYFCWTHRTITQVISNLFVLDWVFTYNFPYNINLMSWPVKNTIPTHPQISPLCQQISIIDKVSWVSFKFHRFMISFETKYEVVWAFC